jgi:hypothetical protein
VLQLVGKRIADLGPRVPRVTLRVTPQDPAVVVTLDGAVVPAGSIGTTITVDPGEHHIEASAPNRPVTTARVRLHERDVTTVDLKLNEPIASQSPPVPPPPTPAPTPTPATPSEPLPVPVPPPPPPTPEHPASSSRVAAILTTAGTVVLAGGGVAAFVLAGNKHSDGVHDCAGTVSDAPGACDSQKNTVRALDVAAVSAWITGAALGAVSIVLWLHPSAPSNAGASSRVWVGPGSVGVGGTF